MQELSLNTANSHDVILDIIYRIRIRDVMTPDPCTVSPDATIADAKKLMKEKGLTGLPVVKNRKLSGIISIHDILVCLDTGNLTDLVSRYMSKNLTVLEEDMPVSFALSYFEKFNFRRFPVIGRNRELTGIVTSRDINVTLLNEINRELKKIDSLRHREETDLIKGKYYRQFTTRKYDFENAGKTSIAIKKYLQEAGTPQAVIKRVSIAVYELEINQVVHSNGGTIELFMEKDVIIIRASDTGPGITELDRALEEGYSTASEWIRSQGFGAGMGLPNVKKVSDDFQISSGSGRGTEVTIKIFTGNKNEAN